jgi:hypothetical protein
MIYADPRIVGADLQIHQPQTQALAIQRELPISHNFTIRLPLSQQGPRRAAPNSSDNN